MAVIPFEQARGFGGSRFRRRLFWLGVVHDFPKAGAGIYNVAVSAPKRKFSQPKPLADFVGGVVDPVLAKQGFGQSSIILHWDDIMGERLAGVSEPIKLQWPGRAAKRNPETPTEPATLILRVAGGMAIEIQHMAPLLIERLNTHLGWRCIGRLSIRQGPVEKRRGPQAPPPPDPRAVAEAEAATQGVDDAALRAALTQLGARALRGPAR